MWCLNRSPKYREDPPRAQRTPSVEVTVRMSQETYDKLREAAVSESTSVSVYLHRLIRDHV